MRLRPHVVAAVAAVLAAAGMALAAIPLASAGARPGGRSARASAGCRMWQVHTLLRGQGWLESLAFDGRGGMTISALSQGKILRLTRSGHLSTLLAGVSAPGGQVVRGHELYFTTGDAPSSLPTGTVQRLDLRTRARTVWARGLTEPNGLALLANGDGVVTAAAPSDVVLIRVHDRRHPVLRWIPIADGNGVAVDRSGRSIFLDQTFSPTGEVDRVAIAHPHRIHKLAGLGATPIPDDLSIDSAGRLYIPGFGSGRIYRVDAATGRACTIATGLEHPTAAVFGGAGWAGGDLYVPSASGFIYRLSPPRRG
jgi:hypothetical protein